MSRKFRFTFLSILALCAYAGCVLNSSSSSTLSYISSSQQTGAGNASQTRGKDAQHLAMKKLSFQAADGTGRNLSVQVAATFQERETGLMFRQTMPEDEGMIFLFDKEEPLTFWMKNTLIPLDMVFMDRDWKVVSIQKNAKPCKAAPCDLYSSSGNAQYVLEINGGLSDKLGIQKGTTVRLES